ncbi:hypothetical protein DT594_03080 [Halopseudomonas laoshanensis]|uniref:NADH:ubiquinone oxidoreductase intermediate-associated protein 30 domain-containing protein n=1 Tax=Halopseudomonas laoshanensis TaxID=2268758 RepID=A0A7V7GW85_9GAMM|nr:CIA30 family protein [Halopseudomonas laoshanensis]KAA0696353.1 hypothetical protein DT594_03080 [Halopseudomonas laoshanensis]
MSTRVADIYQARQGERSPWTAITDQVMGGVSTAELQQCERHGSACTCLSGRTSLENNGGFIQMKLEIEPSWSCGEYAGFFIELCGPAHDYNLNVKTTQLDKPWQSFRCTLTVEPQWKRFVVPYSELQAHRTDKDLDPATIRSVAVIAIGEAFDVDVCVRRFGFYR